MNKYTKEQNQLSIKLFLSGKPIADIAKELDIARSTVYRWINDYKNQPAKEKQANQQTISHLKNRIKRLETIIEIIKETNCSPSASLKEKLTALESLYGKYSVHILCEALDVPRGTFYNHIFRNKRDNTWYAERREELRIVIQKVYDENNQIFGAGKLLPFLKNKVI